ncbi:MAG: RluA family pseudouridine synthase [Chlamydiales bacterium]|nr:RluA family pseudouridine synthase [Chlamydiales bacterium]
MSLAQFLKSKLQMPSKSIKKAIERGAFTLNGCVERFASMKLNSKDKIEFTLNGLEDSLKAQKSVFDSASILYQDDYLLVYNKPSFMSSEELFSQVQWFPVHRLDKETSGVLLFAKNKKVQILLEDLFRKRLVKKTYVAICSGIVEKNAGVITNPLQIVLTSQGKKISKCVKSASESTKSAITEWECKKRGENITLLYCYPKSGRMHQIRSHLSCVLYPIVGDYLYGYKGVLVPRLFLHALELTFEHPILLKNLTITAELPEGFLKLFM